MRVGKTGSQPHSNCSSLGTATRDPLRSTLYRPKHFRIAAKRTTFQPGRRCSYGSVLRSRLVVSKPNRRSLKTVMGNCCPRTMIHAGCALEIQTSSLNCIAQSVRGRKLPLKYSSAESARPPYLLSGVGRAYGKVQARAGRGRFRLKNCHRLESVSNVLGVCGNSQAFLKLRSGKGCASNVNPSHLANQIRAR